VIVLLVLVLLCGLEFCIQRERERARERERERGVGGRDGRKKKYGRTSQGGSGLFAGSVGSQLLLLQVL
jgi:hypothetical protein